MLQSDPQYDIGEIIECQRTNEMNKTLSWALGWPNSDNSLFTKSKGILPMLIDWRQFDEPLHPSNTTPIGCNLTNLTCYYPQSDDNYNKLQHIVGDGLKMENRFNLKPSVNEMEIGIQCKISCPNGTVQITTFRDLRDGSVISDQVDILEVK